MISNTHFHGLDYLKALAILMVVFIHSSISAYKSNQYVVLDFIDYFFRVSVPLFIFISGFLSYEINFNKVLNRLPRIVIPFLIFSSLGQVLKAIQLGSVNYLDFFYNVLLGKTFGTYYFVFIILYLYLLAPIISRFLRYLNSLLLFSTFTSILYLMGIEYNFTNSFLFDNSDFVLRSPFIWTSFFLFGFWCKKYYDKISIIQPIVIGALSIPLLLFYGANYFLHFTSQVGFLSLTWFFYSFVAILFLFVTSVKFKKNILASRISKHSYLIYLIHFFPIQFFTQFVAKNNPFITFFVGENYAISVLFIFLTSLIFSLVSIMFFSTIPKDKYFLVGLRK